MFFQFNQSKEFKRSELFYACFNNLCYSFMLSALAYAICNLVLVFAINFDDITSVKYILAFIILFAIAFSTLMITFFKADKGVKITESALIFSCGYYAKGYSFKNVIMRDSIISVDYIEDFSLIKTLKADYRNYNYNWIIVGAKYKNIPLVRIQTKDDKIFLLPIQDVNGFINEIK